MAMAIEYLGIAYLELRVTWRCTPHVILLTCRWCAGSIYNDRCPDAHHNVSVIHGLLRYTLHLCYAMVHTALAPMISIGRHHFIWMDTSNIHRWCVGSTKNGRHPDAHCNIYDIHWLLWHMLCLRYAMVHTALAPMIRAGQCLLYAWIFLIFTVSITAPIFKYTVPLVLTSIRR